MFGSRTHTRKPFSKHTITQVVAVAATNRLGLAISFVLAVSLCSQSVSSFSFYLVSVHREN